MKSFTDLFIKRPVLAMVVSFVILIAGLQAMKNLNVRQYPRSDIAAITVTTVYVGADAELVRGFITTPIERAIAAADGIDYIQSQSTQSESVITARLKLNYDANKALSDISSRLELAPSTALRLLSILERRGYVERSPSTGCFRIGVRALELGSIYLQTTSLVAEAQPYLQALAREYGQTANLGVLDRGEVIHVAVVPPNRLIRFDTGVGQRASAHSTGLGKALLAELSDEQLEELVAYHSLRRHTDRTLTTLGALRVNLAQTRERGYAMDDEESEIGLRCIAAAIRDSEDRAVAAVSISGPAFEYNDETVPRYVEAVVRTARDISGRLGNNIQTGRKVS